MTLISRRAALTGAAFAGAGCATLGVEAASCEALYANPLASEADIRGFRLEGQARISFPNGRMRMENVLAPEQGQRANHVLWCPESFPDNIRIRWKFWSLREPGLAMLFFAARGQNGAHVLDPSLRPRNGPYEDYIRGDIAALHVSYFRRREPSERAFNVCNLRKTPGFHLVAQGADPLPAPEVATPPYAIEILKQGPRVAFSINTLPLFEWTDDGTRGPVLRGGSLGFRQLAPLMAEYADLEITRADP